MKRSSRSIIVPEPPFDLTPMIDVVLLLIIFFTLTAQFARSQMRSPMDLPKERGEDTAKQAAKNAIVIDLDAQGDLSMTGGRFTTAEVENALNKAKDQSASLSVEVRAHRDAPSGALNKLAAVLARAGVKNWSLATSGGGK